MRPKRENKTCMTIKRVKNSLTSVHVETIGAWKNHTGIDAGARACAHTSHPPFYTPSFLLYLFFLPFFFSVSRRRKLKKMAIDQEKGVVFVAAKCGCGSNGKREREIHCGAKKRKRKGV